MDALYLHKISAFQCKSYLMQKVTCHVGDELQHRVVELPAGGDVKEAVVAQKQT